MANYNLVVNSTFLPFSFERYMLPYNIYAQAYDEQQAYLDLLALGANTYKERALRELELNKDSKWAAKYLLYAQDIEGAADILATLGLDASVRSRVRGLKPRYYDTVIPVETAIKRLAELAKIADTRDPATRTLFAEMPSIDALIETPTLGRNSYSGSAVEQSAMLSASAASLRKVKDYFGKSNLAYYLKKSQEVGFTREEMEKFRQDFASIPELNRIFNDVETLFNNFDGMSEDLKTKLRGEILLGIMKGAAYKEVNDYMADLALLEHLRARLSRLSKEKLGKEKELPKNLSLPENNITLEVDTKALGADLRKKYAKASLEYLLKIARSKSPEASKVRRYFDKFRIENGPQKGLVDYYKTLDYMTENGIGGGDLMFTDKKAKTYDGHQFTTVGNNLRNHLRELGLTNEKTLNIWTGHKDNISPDEDILTSMFLKNPQTKEFELLLILNIGNPASIIDKFNSSLQETYLTIGNQYLLDAKDKSNMLNFAITLYGDKDGDYSGIYNIEKLDYKTGKVIPARTRVKKDDIPRDTNDNIDYNKINVHKVNGGLHLSWEEGQGFIPTENLSKLVQRALQSNDSMSLEASKHAQKAYQAYISLGMPESNAAILAQNEYKNYLTLLNREANKLTLEGSRGVDVKPIEIE